MILYAFQQLAQAPIAISFNVQHHALRNRATRTRRVQKCSAPHQHPIHQVEIDDHAPPKNCSTDSANVACSILLTHFTSSSKA
jgi:hypothetical protein